jgi:hypothetical protein
MRSTKHRDALVPALLALSLALLIGAWVFGNPPSAAPDEADHYVRALGTGLGDLRGRPPGPQYTAAVNREIASAAAASNDRRVSQVKWQLRTSREFTVPRGLEFSAFGCASAQPKRPWSCLDAGRTLPRSANTPTTHLGTYQPFMYLPSGLAMRLAHSPLAAFAVGRAVNGAISIALLAAAVFLLWNPALGAVSLLGFMAAVTPMVLFLGSTVSPSGPETSAGVCFAAALIRLARGPSSKWTLLGLAAGGCVLALSRPLGPLYVVVSVLALALVVGPRPALLRLGRTRGAVAACGAIVVAMAVGAFWELAYDAHPPSHLAGVLSSVPSSARQLQYVLQQAVGYFGALDSPLPGPAYAAWLLVLAALLAAALVVSDSRDRLRLGLLIVGVTVVTIGIAALQLQTGFDLQGRYVVALLALIPLWAGELLSLKAGRIRANRLQRLALGVAGVTACVHLVAWYANGHRAAVGTGGSWLFPFDSRWDPPGGWIPWLAIVLIAVAIYLLAAVTALRPGGPNDVSSAPPVAS